MSAAPYQAQRSYCSQPPGGDRFNQERREVAACVCVCVCFTRGMTERTGGDKPLATPQKTKKEVIREVTHICACLCVRECYLATHNQEKKTTTFARPEKLLRLISNVQEEIQTNRIFPHLF